MAIYIFAALCPSLTVANGEVSYHIPFLYNGQHVPGTIATITCNSGYIRAGPDRIRCTTSSKWNTGITTCIPSKGNDKDSITLPHFLGFPYAKNNNFLINVFCALLAAVSYSMLLILWKLEEFSLSIDYN